MVQFGACLQIQSSGKFWPDEVNFYQMVWDFGMSNTFKTHLRSAWSEMPVDAASEMIAMFFSPAMKLSFSFRLIMS